MHTGGSGGDEMADSDRNERGDNAEHVEGAPAAGEAAPEAEAPGAESTSAGVSESPAPEEIAALRRLALERDEYLDLLKRTKADFSNYQKRVEAERLRWSAIFQRDLLARFLAAADQCRLAAVNAKEDTSAESLREAVTCVWSEVEKFMTQAGVSRMATEGERFDPHRHQAVQMMESAELPDGSVVTEVSPGYEMGEHVLRAAQVVVSKRPTSASSVEPEPPAEEKANEGENVEEAGRGSRSDIEEGPATRGGE